MQPLDAQKGATTKSHLLDSLKVYLNNGSRLQPIIGLGSIIECVTPNTHNSEELYLCQVCVLRLSKGDVRNHIVGSLHRYNYIKARHPHLVSKWRDNTDLSKLAWPLMEEAKKLEREEGPGDVQLLEVDDAFYQRMLSSSGNDAIALINVIRNDRESQSETTTTQPESRRVVLCSNNQQMPSEGPAAMSAGMDMFPLPPLQSPFTPPCTKPELSKSSDSFLDGYSHLFGLCRVLECKNEEGETRCFLCHCCHKRTNKVGIVHHLSSTSHLIKYLRETRPEQMAVLMADITDNKLPLQSLVQEVEKEEGRGRPTVVKLPEPLCLLMSNKSYNWCRWRLNIGSTYTSKQNRKLNVKGPSANKTTNEDLSIKSAVKKRKMRKRNNTVFKVSLPLTQGSMLLERTSFSEDRVPLSHVYWPPSESDHMPEMQSEDFELDCDDQSFLINEELSSVDPLWRPQQDEPCDGDAEGGQNVGPERNQEVDGGFSLQSESSNGAEDQSSWVKNRNAQHSSVKGLNRRLTRTVWQNEVPQTQNWSHSWDELPHHSPPRCTGDEQRNNLESNTGTSVGVLRDERWEMSSNAVPYYYHQHHQYDYMTQGGAVAPTPVGQHGAPLLDAPSINVHLHIGDPFAPRGSTAPEPQPHAFQADQNQWQSVMTCMPFGQCQAAPQSYAMQATAQSQSLQVDQEVAPNYYSYTGPTADSEQSYSHPTVIWTPR